MKLINTPEQIAKLAKRVGDARHSISQTLFDCKSSDAVSNAQRNLQGRTHYVDADTLRWHKCRVLSAHHKADGLLFKIVTSDAADMNNTRRVFRVVIFDIFGTTVYRPDLDKSPATRVAAEKMAESFEFDLVAHYKATFADMSKRASETAKALKALCKH